MELSITEQALSLLCFSALGLLLGLVYDLLRQPRYSLRHPLLWDGLFCALAAGGCFMLSMARGGLGVWEILMSLTGFCLYINCISARLFPVISHFFRLISRFVRFLEKKYFFCKKIFSNRNN